MGKHLFLAFFIGISSMVLAGETTNSIRANRNELAIDHTYKLNFAPILDFYYDPEFPVNYIDQSQAKVKLVYNRELQSDMSWDYPWRYSVTYEFADLPGSPSHTLAISSESGLEGMVYMDYELQELTAGLMEAEITITNVTASYFDGASWVSVLSPIGDPHLPSDIHLEFSVTNERFYDLDPTMNMRLKKKVTPSTIELRWDYVHGAEEYEIQWVYVDKMMGDYATFLAAVEAGTMDPENPFLIKEPLNVVVNYNNFKLDNVFAEGLLFFRVRPIGRFIDGVDGDYTHLKNGAWSYHSTRPDLGEPTGTSYLCYHEITEENAFETNNSWVYSVGFSENGKFASGVSYYDGTMRNRQSSAYNSTDDVTLKGESKYDYEGRGVISLPPAPVHGRNLTYEAGFNKVMVGGVAVNFDKAHFDLDNSTTFYPLDDASGISKYFSENNDFAQENQQAIPDANGYVYGQVKYKNDGSGRIKESSGVGETFAMNGDHTVKYYYGSPTTTELRRLFGSNVSGETNYYRKQMVVDANGQIGVSYMDGAGQTIATSLAGTPPSNLIALGEEPDSYITVLNEGNFLTLDGNTLKSSFVFLNAVELNTLSFTYNFTGIIYDFEDICEPPTIKCMDCLYEIGIRVIAPDGTLTEYTKDISAASYDCEVETYLTDFDGSTIWTLPAYICNEIGEYKIIKTLRIKVDEMLTVFSEAIECEDEDILAGMIEDYTESVDISGCFTDCDEFCAYVVGSELGYTEEELTAILANPENPFYSIPAVIAAIDLCKLSNCSTDEIFDGDLDDGLEGEIGGLDLPLFSSQCEGYYSQMAAQVRPEGYEFEQITFWDLVNDDVISNEIDLYTNYEEDGTPIGDEIESAYDIFEGELAFREEWVELLVPYHREYCHYQFCDDLIDSRQFDAEFGMYLNTTFGDTWPLTAAGISSLWDVGGTNPDPFMDLIFNEDGGDDIAFQTALSAGFTHPSGAPTGMNVFDYIQAISGALDVPLDHPQKWFLLQGLYTSTKQTVVDDYKEDNGCEYFDDEYTIFLTGDDAPGVDDGGDGVIDEEDLADFFDAFGDIVVPDVSEVCPTNVATWMSAIPGSCTEELELAGTLDDLEFAFLDYCYEYCGPENPGGFFFNHDPEEDPYPTSDDEKYSAVMEILTDACPFFEIDFETEPPVIEELEGVINQDFTACYYYLIEKANEILSVNTDADPYNNVGQDTPLFPITAADPMYFCGDEAGNNRNWTGAPGNIAFNEILAGVGVGNPACPSILSFQDMSGSNLELSRVYHIANLWKVGVDTDLDLSDFETGYVTADITWDDDDDAATAPIIIKGKVLVADCYEPADWSNMFLALDFPGALDFTFPDWKTDCIDFIYEVAKQNAINAYNDLISQAKTNFLNELDCFTGIDEKFSMEYEIYEYQYTLFYYDQANQLVQTVPPSGVDILTMDAFPDGVWDGTSDPDHKQKTIYTYNGAGLLLESETPDGGTTKFYYDDLYRLRFAQNELQVANNRFSYTKYDELGRSIEAGEAGDVSLTLPDLNTKVNDNTYPSTTVRDYTKSYYEEGFAGVGLSPIEDEFIDGQRNLRGAIGAVEKFSADYVVSGGAILPVAGSEFQTVTSFSYDAHGNVNETVQTNYFHAMEENEHKHIAYEYDLISGNVEEVVYQKGELDEWRHAYHYDAANRLVRVFTSDDGEEWEMDVKYFYYLHGSLARVEKGHDKVQGMDFAYNLQGWLKGINSTTLDPSKDIGKDAHSTGLDKYAGADANGFSLGYYKNDYAPITGASAFAGTDVLMDANATYGELFNGNISTMVTAMKDNDEALITTQGNVYRYDQLQRIKQMDTYQVTDVANFNGTNAFSLANASTTGKYATTYSFDGNGNLLTLRRKNNVAVTTDNLSYTYLDPVNTNQLGHVDDAVGVGVATNDLDDQATLNYEYDQIGQLIRDDEAQIDLIDWTADGKVRKIVFDPATSKPDLRYVYDASGNRIVQITGTPNTAAAVYEYYVYDATGNLMATYESKIKGNLMPAEPGPEDTEFTETYTLKDRNMYGASRVGSKIENRKINSRDFNLDGGESFVFNQETIATHILEENFDKTKRFVGEKFYEMANHLGNVLNVVTDRKVGNLAETAYEGDIVSYSDYYPYGSLLPGRHGASAEYRYGFQGQEMDDEIKGEGNSVNYKYRMHDPRIGRFFAVDPLAPKYPHYTPYQFSGNKVIHKVELEGLEEKDPKLLRGYDQKELDENREKQAGIDYWDGQFKMYTSIKKSEELTSSGFYDSKFDFTPKAYDNGTITPGSTTPPGARFLPDHQQAGFDAIMRPVAMAILFRGTTSVVGGLFTMARTSFSFSAIGAGMRSSFVGTSFGGMVQNGGLNLATQYYGNGGDFSKVDWIGVGVAGGLGWIGANTFGGVLGYSALGAGIDGAFDFTWEQGFKTVLTPIKSTYNKKLTFGATDFAFALMGNVATGAGGVNSSGLFGSFTTLGFTHEALYDAIFINMNIQVNNALIKIGL